MMHRTQISLDARRYELLMGEARRRGVSAAQIVREMIDERIGDRPKPESAIRRLAGIGRGKGDNAAENHDAILYDELQR
jgi:predicted DNA-binding ribbon-helix-helix protein